MPVADSAFIAKELKPTAVRDVAKIFASLKIMSYINRSLERNF
jgi:hypothetical protein